MARTLLVLALAAAVAAPAGARSILSAAPPTAAANAPGHGFSGAFRPGPHRHRHRGDGFRTDGLLYGFGFDYVEYPAAADGGFFADGEAVPARGGVRYLYDRGYPYDHYRPARARAASWREPEEGCTIRREGQVAVHSCRR
ncbi:MAG: hypothetical protein QOH04_1499 [Sphingomonadales bacterium]|jgi:hypothetical protein|nr:hypothetical protein [Sphingomonadales bacterium]